MLDPRDYQKCASATILKYFFRLESSDLSISIFRDGIFRLQVYHMGRAELGLSLGSSIMVSLETLLKKGVQVPCQAVCLAHPSQAIK